MTKETLLLTGARGFIGRHVAVALAAIGYRVRCLSRSTNRARSEAPEIEWFEGDLESGTAFERGLEGTSVAVYLYHAIGADRDYAAREARVARAFLHAAERAGVARIVYLGGVVPMKLRSRHLESRRITGEILRSGRVSTVELRSSMVIGHGSASFGLVRDVAVRLPVVALPNWLDNESCPISICDVAPAIALACKIDSAGSACFELPGPERLSHRRLIEYLTGPLGTKVVERRIGAIRPGIAALGLAAISNVEASLSRELVMGLDSDLCPRGASFWEQIRRPALRPLREAIVDALCDEVGGVSPGDETRRRIARKTLEWVDRLGAPAHE